MGLVSVTKFVLVYLIHSLPLNLLAKEQVLAYPLAIKLLLRGTKAKSIVNLNLEMGQSLSLKFQFTRVLSHN